KAILSIFSVPDKFNRLRIIFVLQRAPVWMLPVFRAEYRYPVQRRQVPRKHPASRGYIRSLLASLPLPRPPDAGESGTYPRHEARPSGTAAVPPEQLAAIR